MPATDLALLIAAAQEAGQVATRYAGPNAQVWDKPDGAGPVTEADLAVNTALHDHLTDARPDYGWLSEESEDDDARLGRQRVFIVDPIDGTRSFIDGSRTWAHSIAVAEEGVVTAAVVYLPLRAKLYAASKGQGATLNGKTIAASPRRDLPGSSVLAARPNLDAQHWPGGVPDINRSHRPSLAYRMSLVAEGRYDAMLTLRDSWEWDIAAGELILREAGAVTSDKAGGPLRFNNRWPQVNGVIAAPAPLHAALAGALGVAQP